jgi:putative hydrolase of the HAD superfamily
MKKDLPITTLFVDIGGVLLTDGWVQKYRSLAAKTFDLNFKEMEIRHYLNFNT